MASFIRERPRAVGVNAPCRVNGSLSSPLRTPQSHVQKPRERPTPPRPAEESIAPASQKFFKPTTSPTAKEMSRIPRRQAATNVTEQESPVPLSQQQTAISNRQTRSRLPVSSTQSAHAAPPTARFGGYVHRGTQTAENELPMPPRVSCRPESAYTWTRPLSTSSYTSDVSMREPEAASTVTLSTAHPQQVEISRRAPRSSPKEKLDWTPPPGLMSKFSDTSSSGVSGLPQQRSSSSVYSQSSPAQSQAPAGAATVSLFGDSSTSGNPGLVDVPLPRSRSFDMEMYAAPSAYTTNEVHESESNAVQPPRSKRARVFSKIGDMFTGTSRKDRGIQRKYLHRRVKSAPLAKKAAAAPVRPRRDTTVSFETDPPAQTLRTDESRSRSGLDTQDPFYDAMLAHSQLLDHIAKGEKAGRRRDAMISVAWGMKLCVPIAKAVKVAARNAQAAAEESQLHLEQVTKLLKDLDCVGSKLTKVPKRTQKLVQR